VGVVKNLVLGLIYYLLSLFPFKERYYGKRIDLKKIRRLLVIQVSGIGDMIFLLPLLKALKDSFTDAYLTFLGGGEGARQILSRTGLVDEIIPYPEKGRERGVRKILLVNELRKRKFDLVITSYVNSNYEFALFSFFTGAPLRVGYEGKRRIWGGKGKGRLYNLVVELPSFLYEKHFVEINLDILSLLGMERREEYPSFHWEGEEVRFAEEFLKKGGVEKGNFLVGIHPGSGEKMQYKRWPIEKFASLIDRLREQYKAKILVLGGREEREVVEDLRKLVKEPILTYIGEDELLKTMALIDRCSLFISNDTGLMHIASFLGIPTVAIFGPTSEVLSGPRGKNSVVIRKSLPCSPCYRFREVKCSHLACLDSLTVEEVWTQVKEFIDRLRLSYTQ